MLTISFDSFRKAAAVYGKFLDEDITAALLQPKFIADVKNHLIKAIDEHFIADSSLGDGGSVTHRGQTHAGFALYNTSKYKEIVVEGTRFRMRKRRMDKSFSGPKSRAFYRNQDRTFAGTIGAKSKARKTWLATPMESRPFEKVWKKRASGRLYDETSMMMQDNGPLRESIGTMRVSVVGNVVQFRPGPDVNYFDRQNDMRPFFVWYLPVDEPVIEKFCIQQLLKVFPPDYAFGPVVE